MNVEIQGNFHFDLLYADLQKLYLLTPLILTSLALSAPLGPSNRHLLSQTAQPSPLLPLT